MDSLYKSVKNIYSHLISDPNKSPFKKPIEELKEKEEIPGVSLRQGNCKIDKRKMFKKTD